MKVHRLIIKLITLLIIVTGSVYAQQQPTVPKEVGPAVGQEIPAFKARDQFGREQMLSSLVGPKGLVLLFVRSADW